MTAAARTPQTFADVLALGDDARVELIDGVIVEKAAPVFEHGRAQWGLAASLRHYGDLAHGDPPGGGPGWWFAPEVDIELAPLRVVRPDMAGWRRDRHPTIPARERPLRVVPEWVCEVLSASNRSHDVVTKVRFYAEARIAHYWMLDPEGRSLTVYRWTDRGYLLALAATADDLVRAEPFDAIEVKVATLLGQA
jgi:Uma2 family endonuclease